MARKEQHPEKSQRRPSGQTVDRPKAESAPVPSSIIRASKTKTPSGVIVARCTCVHEYQDGRYGAGLRVHNVGSKKAVCTVCGVQRGI